MSIRVIAKIVSTGPSIWLTVVHVLGMACVKATEDKGYTIKRSILLGKTQALTKSTIPGNTELIVHVKEDYDYKFRCEKRDELIQSMKACYYSSQKKNLPIYGVHDKMEKYVSGKVNVWIDWTGARGKFPPEEFRLRGEDMYES